VPARWERQPAAALQMASLQRADSCGLNGCSATSSSSSSSSISISRVPRVRFGWQQAASCAAHARRCWRPSGAASCSDTTRQQQQSARIVAAAAATGPPQSAEDDDDDEIEDELGEPATSTSGPSAPEQHRTAANCSDSIWPHSAAAADAYSSRLNRRPHAGQRYAAAQWSAALHQQQLGGGARINSSTSNSGSSSTGTSSSSSSRSGPAHLPPVLMPMTGAAAAGRRGANSGGRAVADETLGFTRRTDKYHQQQDEEGEEGVEQEQGDLQEELQTHHAHSSNHGGSDSGGSGGAARRPHPLRLRSPHARPAPSAALSRRAEEAEAAGWSGREITLAFNACATVGDVEAIWIAYKDKPSLHYRHLTAAVQALARIVGKGRQRAPASERSKVCIHYQPVCVIYQLYAFIIRPVCCLGIII